MSSLRVLFVDDEEDIRFSFVDRFEDQFHVLTAEDGEQALTMLRDDGDIGVVVTDIRMPRKSGIELIREVKAFNPELGFIVVSGHADSEDVIDALRAGARNFLRKPYSFAELEAAIVTEGRHYAAFRQERRRREQERALDAFVTSIDSLTFTIPNDLSWVNPMAFRLVSLMGAVSICDEASGMNVALGLIEMLTNAIEHGNLGISGEEKMALKERGDEVYRGEIAKRAAQQPYASREVRIAMTLHPHQATVQIEDGGEGFDTRHLPDPTDPEMLFALSGRGILLTRSFMDEVTYNDRGNAVTLIKRRDMSPE